MRAPRPRAIETVGSFDGDGASEPAGARAALDEELCYRALTSRDARFDGRFFVGVSSTGVYCRPVCPARTPKRANVSFYSCAAAAEAEGFRPCLRCRPEASPGTPAWMGTSATVGRALRHIEAGALDEAGVEDLATRLGIGERHLRRLFVEHLGVPPLAVAQTRRVQLAKKLIDETSMPMTRIAMDSGFASVRRFNAAIKKIYGRNPTELRRHRRDREPKGSRDLELRLSYRPPFDWPAISDFLELRAIPGIEVVDRSAYRRSVEVGGQAGIISIMPATDGDHLRLRVPYALSRHLVHVVERVRRIFDLGADPAAISARLGADPLLRERVRNRPGLRVPGVWSGFEVAVRAILGQQVSVKGARTLAGRLVERYGRPIEAGEGLPQRLFPSPEAVAGAELEAIGLPRARAHALRNLAGEIVAGRLSLEQPIGLERSIEELTALPGIGEWTAQYIAMRALGEPDAFPAGDLGLRRALERAGRPATPVELARAAERWRPWRAYAVVYLWTTSPS